MNSSGTVTALGVKLENVPRWTLAVAALSAVAVAGWIVLRPAPDLVSAKAASAALQVAVDEYGRHIVETPEAAALLMDDARGRLSVRQYADGCLLIAREAAGLVRSKLVVDLARAGAEGGLAGRQSDDLAVAGALPLPSGRSSLYGPENSPYGAVVGTFLTQGRCLDPHPGDFRSWYGRRDGCQVEVWREWADGCRHVQLLDACGGTWDSHPDGRARVRWTRCVH